jgi:hypothetical protein
MLDHIKGITQLQQALSLGKTAPEAGDCQMHEGMIVRQKASHRPE